MEYPWWIISWNIGFLLNGLIIFSDGFKFAPSLSFNEMLSKLFDIGCLRGFYCIDESLKFLCILGFIEKLSSLGFTTLFL